MVRHTLFCQCSHSFTILSKTGVNFSRYFPTLNLNFLFFSEILLIISPARLLNPSESLSMFLASLEVYRSIGSEVFKTPTSHYFHTTAVCGEAPVAAFLCLPDSRETSPAGTSPVERYPHLPCRVSRHKIFGCVVTAPEA